MSYFLTRKKSRQNQFPVYTYCSYAKVEVVNDADSKFKNPWPRSCSIFKFLPSRIPPPFVAIDTLSTRTLCLCQILVIRLSFFSISIFEICCGSSHVPFELHSAIGNSIISLPFFDWWLFGRIRFSLSGIVGLLARSFD
jgi:hypothetical protein